MNPDAATRPTLRDYLLPLRERWWLVVAIVVVVTGGVYFYEKGRTVAYTASTEVYVTNAASAATNNVSVADQATLLTSTEVAAVVAKKIGWTGSAAGLAASVSVVPSTTTDFITISTIQRSSAAAAEVANAFAQEFITRNRQTLQASNDNEIAALRLQIAELKKQKTPTAQAQVVAYQQQVSQLQLNNNALVANAKQVDVATGGAPVTHKVKEYAALSGVVALIGSILLVYMLYRLDPKLKSVGQAADIYSHPVLATVVHDPDILRFEDGVPGLSPRSQEAFRDLRIALNLASPDRHFASVIVTSAAPGEGKSTVSRNFAIALAEAGLRVALVDADLRKSTLARKLGSESRPGITEVIAGVNTLDEVKREIPIKAQVIPGLEDMIARLGNRADLLAALETSLTLIPAGTIPPNPSAVLESAPFKALLKQLQESYDIVVLDTTPITAVSDAMPVMGEVDAVVLVARSGATDRRTAQRASELIERVPGSNIVGVVVNGVPSAEAAAYGGPGYGYGYGYGYGGDGSGRSKRKDKRSEAPEAARPAAVEAAPPQADPTEPSQEPESEEHLEATEPLEDAEPLEGAEQPEAATEVEQR